MCLVRRAGTAPPFRERVRLGLMPFLSQLPRPLVPPPPRPLNPLSPRPLVPLFPHPLVPLIPFFPHPSVPPTSRPPSPRPPIPLSPCFLVPSSPRPLGGAGFQAQPCAPSGSQLYGPGSLACSEGLRAPADLCSLSWSSGTQADRVIAPAASEAPEGSGCAFLVQAAFPWPSTPTSMYRVLSRCIFINTEWSTGRLELLVSSDSGLPVWSPSGSDASSEAWSACPEVSV